MVDGSIPSPATDRLLQRDQHWFADSGTFVYCVLRRRCTTDYRQIYYARWRNRHRVTSKLVPTCVAEGRVVPLLSD